jgi:hypothetical protein
MMVTRIRIPFGAALSLLLCVYAAHAQKIIRSPAASLSNGPTASTLHPPKDGIRQQQSALMSRNQQIQDRIRRQQSEITWRNQQIQDRIRQQQSELMWRNQQMLDRIRQQQNELMSRNQQQIERTRLHAQDTVLRMQRLARNMHGLYLESAWKAYGISSSLNANIFSAGARLTRQMAERSSIRLQAFERSLILEREAATAVKQLHQVRINRLEGNLMRDQVARWFRENGREVQREVYKWTPFGKRWIDVQVSMGGKVLGGVEVKVGNSPYTILQRAKDSYLSWKHNYTVNVIRFPNK